MIIYFIILLAAAARFVPHMPNFAPITALAIFSAANLGWKKSLAITLAVRLVSDLFLGFFAWPLMLAVYAAHLFGVVLGCWIKKSSTSPLVPARTPQVFDSEAQTRGAGRPLHLLEREKTNLSSPQDMGRVGEGLRKWSKILASGLISTAVFFLLTNFAFFYPSYSHNLAGVVESYVNALPFLRGTLLGDVGYTVALFAAWEAANFWAKNKAGARQWFRA